MPLTAVCARVVIRPDTPPDLTPRHHMMTPVEVGRPAAIRGRIVDVGDLVDEELEVGQAVYVMEHRCDVLVHDDVAYLVAQDVDVLAIDETARERVARRNRIGG